MSESPLVLSGSSLNTFLRCGKQWEFAYVKGIKRPPNVRMLVGLATHEAIEVDMRQKMDTSENLPIADVIDVYSTAFDRDGAEVEIEADEPLGPAKDSGIELVKIHRDNVGAHIMPIAVEEQVQFEVNGIAYSGYLDIVDEHGVIRDTKTSARKLEPDKYRTAMTGYALGWYQKMGRTDMTGMDEVVTLDGLIRTKKPYYQQESLTIDGTDVRRFASVVELVNAAILEGTFVPNGLVSGACGWCGYNDICPAYRNS